ncbi:MAG: hypothetical protein EDM71_04740, partial [Proteobacteria bacterium]
IPIAAFALPALALAIRLAGHAGNDQREAAWLAVMLLSCGLWQLEPTNPESLAWFAVCLLLALPWGGALCQEVARLGHGAPVPCGAGANTRR